MPEHRSLGMGSGGTYMPKGDEISVVAPLTGTIIDTEYLTGTLIVTETLTATIRCLNP